MQKIIDELDDIIVRFDERAPLGQRFHTVTKQDFLDLAKCARALAVEMQNTGVEID